MQKAQIMRSRLLRQGQVPHTLVVAGKPAELDNFEGLAHNESLFQETLGASRLTRLDHAELPPPVIYSYTSGGWQVAALETAPGEAITAAGLAAGFQRHRGERDYQTRRYRLHKGLDEVEVEQALRRIFSRYRDRLESVDVHLDGIFQSSQAFAGNSPTLREKPRAYREATEVEFRRQEAFARLGLSPFPEDLPSGKGVTVVILDTSPEVSQVSPKSVDFWLDLSSPRDYPPPLPYEEDSNLLDTPHLRSLPDFRALARNRSHENDLDSRKIQDYHGLMIAALIRQVAPEATIVLVKALDENGEAAGMNLTLAMELVHFLQQQKITVNGRRVIEDKLALNMSYGLYRTQSEEVNAPYMLAACNRLCRDGALIVAATGNNSFESHPQNPQEPAAYGYFADTAYTNANLICVAATGEKPTSYAWFSNQSNLAAPGYDLVLDLGEQSSGAPCRYVIWSGTSFATPLITGCAAALLSAPSDPAPAEVKQALWKGATPPADWNGVFEVNLPKALAALNKKTARPKKGKAGAA